MLETTSTPSIGWTHVALFPLLWIEQPVGISRPDPRVSQQQLQEPNDRETSHVPQSQLSSSHVWDHRTNSRDDIERCGHLGCIQYKRLLSRIP